MTDIIIFSGQSNMQGETESKPIEKPVEKAFEYLMIPNYLEPLNHPVGERLGYDENNCEKVLLGEATKKRGSLVPYFCKEYVKNKQRVVAIHTALGCTVISKWQKGTDRYAMMIEKVKKGIEKVKETDTINKIYFVWLQGESDAITRTSRKDYYNYLIALKNALKTDVSIDKFCIIRVGYFYCVAGWLNDVPFEERRKFDEAIMQAQEDAVRKDKDFVMLTRITKKLSMDKKYISIECDGHYNNMAMKILGKSAGKKLAQISEKN